MRDFILIYSCERSCPGVLKEYFCKKTGFKGNMSLFYVNINIFNRKLVLTVLTPNGDRVLRF